MGRAQLLARTLASKYTQVEDLTGVGSGATVPVTRWLPGRPWCRRARWRSRRHWRVTRSIAELARCALVADNSCRGNSEKRTARCAVPWVAELTLHEGGATPRNTPVLDPAPRGAGPSPEGRSPFACLHARHTALSCTRLAARTGAWHILVGLRASLVFNRMHMHVLKEPVTNPSLKGRRGSCRDCGPQNGFPTASTAASRSEAKADVKFRHPHTRVTTDPGS